MLLPLVKALKAGIIHLRALNEAEKLNAIKELMDHGTLFLKDSRITDVPLMGNALESIYIKL